MRLNSLVHNGVYIPPVEYHGLCIYIRGKKVKLTPKQELMAIAWVKKLGTPYVKDPVFTRNFFKDFSDALGFDETLSPEEIDFTPVIEWVEKEKQRKKQLSKEERKRLREERKNKRKQLKEKYGIAYVNGKPMEIANFVVEPSSIFMGRGEHPLRGRWKEGAKEKDIILNLSPDAPVPPGKWKKIVWEPKALWIAKWEDKLTGRIKYVWISDTSPLKQEREKRKYDKALELRTVLKDIRTEIRKALKSKDPRKRQIATAVYLIDALSLRVGDEKDPGEADTVGATTLRPEHVTIHDDGTVEFHFLGKDSVPWHKTIKLPRIVIRNLRELIANARAKKENADPSKDHPSVALPTIFPDISSRSVNRFLSRLMPGLTAKVFRTHHATLAVENALKKSKVRKDDPEYIKKAAAVRANLAAAKVCNHYKKESTPWERRKERFEVRIKKAKERVEKAKLRAQKAKERLDSELKKLEEHMEKKEEIKEKIKVLKMCSPESPKEKKKVKREIKKLKSKLFRIETRIKSCKKRISSRKKTLERANHSVKKTELSLERIKTEYQLAAETRNWNLTTSLKSYIDPRVFKKWFDKVNFDWRKYYPKSLAKKFMWCFEP